MELSILRSCDVERGRRAVQLMAADMEERAMRPTQCRMRIGEHFELSRAAARYADFYRGLDEKRKRK